MDVLKLASFSEGSVGGNPAGVCLLEDLPDAAAMQACAKEVGFSETVFACPTGQEWRVRYFSPASEVPFCGHATIALGAALARKHGDNVYALKLNDADITVEGRSSNEQYFAALQSPPTRSAHPSPSVLQDAMSLFGLQQSDLNMDLPPQLIHAGADHLAILLKDRKTLSDMRYDLEDGKTLMLREGWITIMLAYAETPQKFHSRNPFASSGIYEDPATGAATAAFAGYLNDAGWPHQRSVQFIQGEDAGVRSRLNVDIPAEKGASIRVSGEVRPL